MRLRPGLVNNFTILQHDFIMHELFKRETDPEKIDKAFKLPKHIVPLCNNSALSAIIAAMPHCNAHSVKATWDVPPEEDVRRFFDTTVERPVKEEKWLVRDTTEAELEFIARRVEEDRLAREAGEYGYTLAELDKAQEEESLAEQGMLAGEGELVAPG
jgi:hypothetical protein